MYLHIFYLKNIETQLQMDHVLFIKLDKASYYSMA